MREFCARKESINFMCVRQQMKGMCGKWVNTFLYTRVFWAKSKCFVQISTFPTYTLYLFGFYCSIYPYALEVTKSFDDIGIVSSTYMSRYHMTANAFYEMSWVVCFSMRMVFSILVYVWNYMLVLWLYNLAICSICYIQCIAPVWDVVATSVSHRLIYFRRRSAHHGPQ